MLIDDQTLTDQGLIESQGGRVLLIACGALAREILDIKERGGWDNVDLQCLPAILHNHPEQITPRVRETVEKHRDSYAQIFVVYADCGTGGMLEAVCQELGVKMVSGPHCYSFFEGNARFAEIAEDEITAFYVTDFLARQFDAFVWKPLGMDRHPELVSMYFGNYEKLVYLAQTDDPEITAKAQDCADKMGLAFERRMTGYGDLQTTLRSWILTSNATK